MAASEITPASMMAVAGTTTVAVAAATVAAAAAAATGTAVETTTAAAVAVMVSKCLTTKVKTSAVAVERTTTEVAAASTAGVVVRTTVAAARATAAAAAGVEVAGIKKKSKVVDRIDYITTYHDQRLLLFLSCLPSSIRYDNERLNVDLMSTRTRTHGSKAIHEIIGNFVLLSLVSFHYGYLDGTSLSICISLF